MKKTVPVSEHSPETLHSMRAEANIWAFTKRNLQWKCLILSIYLNFCWIKGTHSLTVSSANKKWKQPMKPEMERKTWKQRLPYSCFSNTQVYCCCFAHSGFEKSESSPLGKSDTNKFSTCFTWHSLPHLLSVCTWVSFSLLLNCFLCI